MGRHTGETRTRRTVNVRSGGETNYGICERCGKTGWPGTSVHHRKNRSQGGKWTPENCMVLCGSGTTGCHGWVTVHPEAARAEGLVCKSVEDPAKVQALTFRAGWVYLSDTYLSPAEVDGVAS